MVVFYYYFIDYGSLENASCSSKLLVYNTFVFQFSRVKFIQFYKQKVNKINQTNEQKNAYWLQSVYNFKLPFFNDNIKILDNSTKLSDYCATTLLKYSFHTV